jgi:hypothetical protein
VASGRDPPDLVLLGSSGAAFVYVAPDMQGVGGSLLTGAFRGLWPWLEMAGGMHLMLCTPNLLHRIDRPNVTNPPTLHSGLQAAKR